MEQASLNFDMPRPGEPFKSGTQGYRIYEQLLA